jgi:hypothetical protein
MFLIGAGRLSVLFGFCYQAFALFVVGKTLQQNRLGLS